MTQSIPTATLPLTYADIVCLDDCDPLMTETTSDYQSLIQDCLHVILEEAESNLDDVNRGLGIEKILGGTNLTLANIASNAVIELKKDSRIDDASAVLTQNTDTTFSLNLTIAVAGVVTGAVFNFNSAGNLLP